MGVKIMAITVVEMIRWLARQPRNGVLVGTQRKGGAWQHPDVLELCERKTGQGDAEINLMVIAPSMVDQVLALPPKIGGDYKIVVDDFPVNPVGNKEAPKQRRPRAKA